MLTQTLTNVGDTLTVQMDDDTPQLSLQCAGTFSAATCVFEGRLSPDMPWVPVEFSRSVGNVAETTTGSLSAPPNYSWDASGSSYAEIRVRLTAKASGAMIWGATQSSEHPDNSPFVPTHAVTGSGTFTVQPASPTTLFQNSAATTNATAIKTSAGTLYALTASNANAAVRHLKLYNKASAPTVGTDIPVLTVPLPPGQVTHINLGAMGLRFATGIASATTVNIADTDTAAVAAGEIKSSFTYI